MKQNKYLQSVLKEFFKLNSMLLLFINISATSQVVAQEVDYSGTSVANFLKIGVGAREMAMGDAATATVNTAAAMYWNVAALSRIEENVSVVISSMDWLVDTRNSYFAAALKVDGLGTFGVDFHYLDYGEIEETTVYDQDGTGRFFSARDLAVGLGYSRSLTDRFSFGIKVKYISEVIANASADAFGVDLGAVFTTSFFNNNLRLAANLSNFGTKMKFSGRDLAVTYTIPGSPSNKQIPADLTTIDWDIPLLFRFGISNYFVNNDELKILVAYDILDSRDFDVRQNLGAEIGFSNVVFLRGGYKFNYDEVDYTAGLGFDFGGILDYGIKLDYNYLDFGVFDGLNQFTLVINL
jgi:hypothetical protein